MQLKIVEEKAGIQMNEWINEQMNKRMNWYVNEGNNDSWKLFENDVLMTCEVRISLKCD